MSAGLAAELVELLGVDRASAIPVVDDGFEGIYRWHARRKLRDVPVVRAVRVGNRIVGVAMLDRIDEAVGYVYYVAVSRAHRGRGLGGRLLDDALHRFRADRLRVAYGAVEEENAASIALFRSRGFRTVDRAEPGFRDGGLGAWGLRSRMMLVPGEVLFGIRLAPAEGDRPGVSDLPGPTRPA